MKIQLLYVLRVLSIAIFVAIIPGCSDRLDMEDVAFSLAVGLDLDKENNLLVYSTNPAFSKNVKKKIDETVVKAQTLRQSRGMLDVRTSGAVLGRKTQILLVGKSILQHEDWFRLLDPYFRDAKNSLSARVIAVDGPVSEIIFFNPEDKPILPIYMIGLIKTASNASETVNTTLQELHRQMFEKGVTPYISEITMEKEVALQGTALLDHKGKYVDSLSVQENILMQMLKKNLKKPITLSLPIPGEPKSGPFNTDRISINVERIKTEINTSYLKDKFQFDIKVNMPVVLAERLFTFDVLNRGEELEKMISVQVQKQFENLIKKIQTHKLDPFGLGLYARAYEYNQYKKVEDHWGDTLADADIHVSVNVTIRSMGPVK
ncbi:Ger(x)C family spore germination protein [Paenibacillus sp. HWE-109]|uniref:Ger(x)C family spore germination protein n=1 Tax=Paenibacillus sp. HWE-109 TaxID=1306526 RepID=UPI001EDECE4C|nr:Ger(x)C family spore germination protein [Paenibacillus sp. HWE-109]UKS28019.1 Ger(x)C family spore germination protein [Paenibacillus sp. HWE-109]